MSECSLVGKSFPRFDEAADLFFLCDMVGALCRINKVFSQPDVQQLPFAYNVFVLREKEGQLGQLDAEGDIRTYHVLTDVISVVLAH